MPSVADPAASPIADIPAGTVDGNDLYLAIDNDDDSNGVYLLRDFAPSAGIRAV